MKAKELMISDWVYLSFDLLKDACKPFPARINMDYLVNIYYGKFVAKPIPLSEEILKANGFIGSTNECYQYNCGVYLIDIRCGVGEIEIYEEKGHWTSGYVCKSVNVDSFHYVHELQHALRLCGLNDLADNFKIE